MRNVLVVINDENLINRMKLSFDRKDYDYFYATDGAAAISIADSNEISVAVVYFRMPVLSGPEICETLSSTNFKMQFVILFDEQDIEPVLHFYNRYHIAKLMCTEEFELEMLHGLIEDCMHIYYRREELVKLKEKVEAVSEKYLKPMTDMSNLLNERLKCYEYVVKIFMCCIDEHVDNYEGIKALNVFVDRIVNDFIHLFLIKEPDSKEFLENLNVIYNKPDSKKYFKFVNNDANVDGESQLNILFALNVITICFDVFFSMYRGKVELSENETGFEINSVYEIRYTGNSKDIAERALNICRIVLNEYCDTLKFARKDDLVQFKAGFKKSGVIY